jgi:hypothetical protein
MKLSVQISALLSAILVSFIQTAISIVLMPVKTIARPISHRIGFVKPIECARSYWISNEKYIRNENKIIAQACFSQVSKEANMSMNIDGSLLNLNRVKIGDKGNKIFSTYQSFEFIVQENVSEISGCNNRKNNGVSELSGTITITSNKGWKKVILVKGIWDNCG